MIAFLVLAFATLLRSAPISFQLMNQNINVRSYFNIQFQLQDAPQLNGEYIVLAFDYYLNPKFPASLFKLPNSRQTLTYPDPQTIKLQFANLNPTEILEAQNVCPPYQPGLYHLDVFLYSADGTQLSQQQHEFYSAALPLLSFYSEFDNFAQQKPTYLYL